MEMESDSNIPKVSIMTLHAAKGLEFPVVLLPGWEDGLFPSQRSMDQKGLKGLEEERRLAHVGITRAEQYCIISFATSRRIFNQWQNSIPSRFINELNEKDIEILNTGSNFGLQMSDTFSQPIMSSNGGDQQQLDDFKKYDTPGWQRMQKNFKKKSIMPRALGDFQPVNAPHDLNVGMRVFHQKFGYGIIEIVDGDKVKVAFEKAESKDIQASFLVREEDI